MIVRMPEAAGDAGRGRIVESFTEAVDCLPTILDWLEAEIPRQCDGRSLLPFCRGEDPAGWREEAHFEFDFRDVAFSHTYPEAALGLHMDRCSLAALRGPEFKYVHFAALPPLLFDLRRDPAQLENRAQDPSYAGVVRDCAQRMLSWRLEHADRSLTGYRATPGGLESRR
jgi:arylsulfatase A-like enzyme